jgi:DNA mismatch repair protein MutL
LGKIIQLDKELINKIAAGEVIERPASVVKELIENSIDAGAMNISVDIKEGGKSFISVTDDGEGMEKDDARIAIKKHTTSKIKTTEDLFRISTLGFRGEALSSIAAISNMELRTKTESSSTGIKLQIEAGNIVSENETGCAKGTSIIVNDLFYNTPGRKKHLKDMGVEFRHITEVVTRYALANPGIGFKLSHNDNIVLHCPATTDLMSTAVGIFGKEFGKQLIDVRNKTEAIEVNGFIGKPSLSRADKNTIYTFVNSRYVKNKILSDAVVDAYHTLLGTQRFPVAILNFKIPAEKIDVNVHPTKIEIRIENEAQAYSDIFDIVKSTLEMHALVPEAEPKTKQESFKSGEKKKEKEYKNKPLDKKPAKQAEIQINDFEIEVPAYNILGKIHKTFIVVETKQGMRLIDQHAAHERILYEQLLNEFGKQGVKKQQLLQPIKLELSPADMLLVKDNNEIVNHYGFEAEDFGKNTIILRSLPSVLGRQLNKEILVDLLDELKQSKVKSTIDTIKEKMLIRMACRAAEKAGDNIELAEMQALIASLEKCKNPYTCPHGRPTMIDYTITDLEKSFNRIRSEKNK